MSNFTWSMFDAFHERVNVKESLWEKHEPVLFCNFKPEGLQLNTVVQVNEKIQVFDVSNNPDSCLYRLHYYQEFPANEQVLDRLIQKLEKKNTIRLKGNDKFETRIYEPLKPDERFKAHQVIYTDIDYYVSQKGQQIFDAKVLDWIHTILPESPTKKDLLYIHATTGKNIGLYVKDVDADDILLCIYGSAIMRNGKCIHGNGLFKENSNLLNNYDEMFDYVVYKKFDENRSTDIPDLIENEEKEQ